MAEQTPGAGAPPINPDAEPQLPNDQNRIAQIWLEFSKLVEAGDAWVNKIPHWIPVLPEYCRYYLSAVKASSTALFRRDEHGQPIPTPEALRKSAQFVGEAVGHLGASALDAIGIYFILQAGANALSRHQRPGENGRSPLPQLPGPAPNEPSPAAAAESTGAEPAGNLEDGETVSPLRRLIAYLDKALGSTDEKIVLEVIKGLNVVADFIPNTVVRASAKSLLAISQAVWQRKYAEAVAEQKAEAEGEPAPGDIAKNIRREGGDEAAEAAAQRATEEAGTLKGKAAEKAVETADEVVQQAGPANPPPADWRPSIAYRTPKQSK